MSAEFCASWSRKHKRRDSASSLLGADQRREDCAEEEEEEEEGEEGEVDDEVEVEAEKEEEVHSFGRRNCSRIIVQLKATVCDTDNICDDDDKDDGRHRRREHQQTTELQLTSASRISNDYERVTSISYNVVGDDKHELDVTFVCCCCSNKSAPECPSEQQHKFKLLIVGQQQEGNWRLLIDANGGPSFALDLDITRRHHHHDEQDAPAADDDDDVVKPESSCCRSRDSPVLVVGGSSVSSGQFRITKIEEEGGQSPIEDRQAAVPLSLCLVASICLIQVQRDTPDGAATSSSSESPDDTTNTRSCYSALTGCSSRSSSGSISGSACSSVCCTTTTSLATTTSQSLASSPDMIHPADSNNNDNNNKCRRDFSSCDKCLSRYANKCRRGSLCCCCSQENRMSPSQTFRTGRDTIARETNTQSADLASSSVLPTGGGPPTGCKLKADDHHRGPSSLKCLQVEGCPLADSRPRKSLVRQIDGANEWPRSESRHANAPLPTTVVSCPTGGSPVIEQQPSQQLSPSSSVGPRLGLSSSGPRADHNNNSSINNNNISSRNLLSPMDVVWRPNEGRALSCTEASLSNSIAAQLAAAVRSKSLCSETRIVGLGNSNHCDESTNRSQSGSGLAKRIGKLTRQAIKQIKRISLSNPTIDRPSTDSQRPGAQQQQQQQHRLGGSANYRYGELRRACSQRRPSTRRSQRDSPMLTLRLKDSEQDMAKLAAKVASVKRAASVSCNSNGSGANGPKAAADEICVLPHQLSRFKTNQGQPLQQQSESRQTTPMTGNHDDDDDDDDDYKCPSAGVDKTEIDDELFYSPSGVYIGPGGICSWQQVCPEQQTSSDQSDISNNDNDHDNHSDSDTETTAGRVRDEASWGKSPKGAAGALSWLSRPLRRGVAQALLGAGSAPLVPDVVLIQDEQDPIEQPDKAAEAIAAAEVEDEDEEGGGEGEETGANVESSFIVGQSEEEVDDRSEHPLGEQVPATMSPSSSSSSSFGSASKQQQQATTSNSKIWIMNLTQRVGSAHSRVNQAPSSLSMGATDRIVIHASESAPKATKASKQARKPERLVKGSRSNSLSGLFQRVSFVDLSKSSLELHRHDQRIVEQTEKKFAANQRHSTSDDELDKLHQNQLQNGGSADPLLTSDEQNCDQQKPAETYGATLQASCVHCQLIAELSSHPQSSYLSQLVASASRRREDEPLIGAPDANSKAAPVSPTENTTPVRPSVVLTVCSNQSTMDNEDEDEDNDGDDYGEVDDDQLEDETEDSSGMTTDDDCSTDQETHHCYASRHRRKREQVQDSASSRHRKQGRAAGRRRLRSSSSVNSLVSRSSDDLTTTTSNNNNNENENDNDNDNDNYNDNQRYQYELEMGQLATASADEQELSSSCSSSSLATSAVGSSSAKSLGSSASLLVSCHFGSSQLEPTKGSSTPTGCRRASGGSASASARPRIRKRRVKRRRKRGGSACCESKSGATVCKVEVAAKSGRHRRHQASTCENDHPRPPSSELANSSHMLEVPSNKQARSASLDAPSLLKVPQDQQDPMILCDNDDHDHDHDHDHEHEHPNGGHSRRNNKSNRSRSVDISLPTKPGESYLIRQQIESSQSGAHSGPQSTTAPGARKSMINDKKVGEYFVDACQLIEGRNFDLASVQKKFIQGEVKVTCANGEARALKLFVDWSENCINGEHLWIYVGSSSEACYVGENDCLKHGPRLCCSACKITAHTGCIGILIDKIKFICKHTYRDLTVNIPRHLKELQQQNVIYHHWVHKRTHCGRCKLCAKTFGNTKLPFSSKEIQAITCSWCKVSYHNKENCYTLSALTEPCSLGAHRESIIPPPWILKLPSSGNSQQQPNVVGQAQNMIESQSDNLVESFPSDVQSNATFRSNSDSRNKENSEFSGVQRQQRPQTINRPQNFGSNTTLMTDTSGYMSAENSNLQSICSNTIPPSDNLDQSKIISNNSMGANTNEHQNELIIDPTALQASDLSLINQAHGGQQPRHPQENMSQFQKHQLRQYYRQMDSSSRNNETNLRRDGDDGSVMMDIQLSQPCPQRQQLHQQPSFKQPGQGIYQNFHVVPQVIHGIPNAGSKPVLVFVNPRSGGNQGAKMMQKFNWLLNPRQVFDLIQSGGPRAALELYRDVPNLRILTIGGDGTASWILSYLDEVGIPNKIPVAVLPLGTGNDLARALGWGGGYADEPIAKILTQIRDGEVVQLDRWNLHVERNLEVAPSSPNEYSTSSVGCANLDMSPPSLSSSPSYGFSSSPQVTNSSSTISIIDQTTNCDTSMIQAANNPASSHADEAGSDRLPMDVINNYFSFGVDAHIALEFHTAREAHPERFNSRLRNKMFYGQAGGKDLLKRKWKDLSNFVTLYCDDHDMTGRLKELKVHSVLFLNIPSYGGGTRPWPTTATSFARPRTDDGLIEVIGLTTYQLPLLQAGGHGTCIAQCRSARIITSRTIPMQVDGEPCKLLPSIINISFRNRVCMLAKSKNFHKNINMTNSNDRKY